MSRRPSGMLAPGVAEPFEAAAPTAFRLVSIDSIERSPFQPRAVFDPASLKELADSIRERGVLQPIRVREIGGRLQLISGERRWLAAKQAGLACIPVIVAASSDADAMVEALIENIHREDLNAVDRAAALRNLRAALNLRSWEEVGRRIGISRVHVHRLLRVQQLPAPIQNHIRRAGLTEKHARALGRLPPGSEEQLRLLHRIQTEGLSGQESLAAAQEAHALPDRERAGPRARRPADPATVDALADALLTAIVNAKPAELDRARPVLHDLSRWLVAVLQGHRPVRLDRSPGA